MTVAIRTALRNVGAARRNLAEAVARDRVAGPVLRTAIITEFEAGTSLEDLAASLEPMPQASSYVALTLLSFRELGERRDELIATLPKVDLSPGVVGRERAEAETGGNLYEAVESGDYELVRLIDGRALSDFWLRRLT